MMCPFAFSLPRNEQGCVSYAELMQKLNWRDCPVPPIQYAPVRPDEAWQGNPASTLLQSVNVAALQADLGGPCQ